MQALVSLLAGEENAHSDAFDEPDGPRLTVTAARPYTAWVEGAFELAKAGFALLAERYPDNVCFADRSARGKQEMMDLQLFADGGEAAAPALSAAQEQQAVASGTMKPGEKADARQETTAPEGEKEVKETEPVKAEEGQEQEPPRPALPKRFPGSQAVDALHRRWAAEEAMMRRAVPEFSLQKELADPEMRRLMQLPGMRMLDAYRLAHYGDVMRQTARTVEQGVVERIRQRGARPAENGTHPQRRRDRCGCEPDDPQPAGSAGTSGTPWRKDQFLRETLTLRSACQRLAELPRRGSLKSMKERIMTMNNFNIQLFAETPLNSTTTMTPEMKTFYEKRLIDQAEPRLVHDQFADYYPVPQNGGKTIEFRKYDSLPKAATPLTEGVTPDGQALNVTTITSDLHQYGGWTR